MQFPTQTDDEQNKSKSLVGKHIFIPQVSAETQRTQAEAQPQNREGLTCSQSRSASKTKTCNSDMDQPLGDELLLDASKEDGEGATGEISNGQDLETMRDQKMQGQTLLPTEMELTQSSTQQSRKHSRYSGNCTNCI